MTTNQNPNHIPDTGKKVPTDDEMRGLARNLSGVICNEGLVYGDITDAIHKLMLQARAAGRAEGRSEIIAEIRQHADYLWNQRTQSSSFLSSNFESFAQAMEDKPL